MSFTFKITDVAGSIKQMLVSVRDPVAKAVTDAMKDTADAFKRDGRASFAAGGLSTRWQNAWRVEVYPKGKNSLTPAAYAFHKIPYSAVFEEGATITGHQGLLWIPLPSTPRIGRRKPTPKLMAAQGVKLFSLKGKSGKPILAAAIRQTGAQAAKGFTFAKLKKGAAGKRGEVRAVPLFIGVKSVTLRRRTKIAEVTDRLRAELPGRVAEQLSKVE